MDRIKKWFKKPLHLFGTLAVVIVLLVLVGALIYYFFFWNRITEFEKNCLEEHNKYRKLHGAPDLELNKAISRFAAAWAEEIADKGNMQHRIGNSYGENLAYSTGKDFTCKGAVGMWYSEIKSYNYEEPKYQDATGHFTQLIWKASKQLGCGTETKNGATFVVCNYDPPGNLNNPEAFKENVLPKT